jgi:hypothetical protein
MFDEDCEKLNWALVRAHHNSCDRKSATRVGDGNDPWGYLTRGEAANYGEFIDGLGNATLGVYPALLSTP